MIDLVTAGFPRSFLGIKYTQYLNLIFLAKKSGNSFILAAMVLTATSIFNPSLASSGDTMLLGVSGTLLDGHGYSTLSSHLTNPVFDLSSHKNITSDYPPSYRKSVVLALIRWVFNEPSDVEEYTETQVNVSLMIALLTSAAPNKVAIVLGQVRNKISREGEHVKESALEKLDKAATKKAKQVARKLAKREALMQSTRLTQIETSMQQYAALNDKAYRLGFETFNRLKDIEARLTTPLHERASFKTGIDIGKKSYDLSATNRGSFTLSEPETQRSTADAKLIEADKKTNAN